MEFDEWEPVYEAILADFGFDRGADERARDLLAVLCTRGGPTFDPGRLDVAGDVVAVVGAGPSLPEEFHRVEASGHVFAASTAADVLREHGLAVDCMVTDVDGNPRTAVELTREGTPVAVHAHGDNIAALREYVPEMDLASTIPTTQAAPAGIVRNVGGFTDGDRAAFLADHLGAARLVFAGWDLDDSRVGPVKRRKLRWAERLLYWLECRRGECFGVLDGRRGRIDAAALPL